MKFAALFVLVFAVMGCGSSERQPHSPYKVGYTDTQYHDKGRDRPLHVKLWYPADFKLDEPPIGYDVAFEGRAVRNVEYLSGPSRHPLVVLSHGDKGSNIDQSWLAEALAAKGYIVASVAHWMNTWKKNDPVATLRVWDRPQDLSFLVTVLLADPIWGQRIDSAKIGAAGHSSGGYTVLALAGAIYQPKRMAEYCAGSTQGLDCKLAKGLKIEGIDFSQAAANYRDQRIRAVFAMAPALGPGITEASLKAIDIPVKVVAAEDDEFLPIERHAASYAGHIPGARLTRLPTGGHFTFMPECTLMGMIFLYFHDYDICGRRAGSDRAAMHALIAQEALRFFDSNIIDENAAAMAAH